MQSVIGAHALRSQHGKVARHAQQTEADDEHAGDGTAAKRNGQRGVKPVMSCLGSADVGAHRYVHAHITGGRRQQRADRKADAGRPAQRDGQHHEQHQADNTDGCVLTVQIGFGPFLNGPGNFLHACISCILFQNPLHGNHAVKHRQ